MNTVVIDVTPRIFVYAGWNISVGRAASIFSFTLKKEAAVSTEVLVLPFKRHRVTSHKTAFVLCTAVKNLRF
jgi:hypothetical protein